MDFIFVKVRILAKQQQAPVTSLSSIYCILPFIFIYLLLLWVFVTVWAFLWLQRVRAAL